MTDLNDNNITYDAEQLAEEIAKGEEETPKVNVEADYERSKQFDVADIDRTPEGSKAANDAASLTGNTPTGQAGSGDPKEFRKMAKEVNSPDQ